MSISITNYIGLGVLVAALATGVSCCADKARKNPEQEKPRVERTVKYGVEQKVIIPGTCTYDVDSMSLPGSEKDSEKWAEHVELSFSPDLLAYGANSDECNLWWYHIDKNTRKLLPQNGAELALLGKVGFEKLTLEDLISAKYSKYMAIPGNDDNNQLPVGTVIGVKTNQGNYAKIRIEGYFPLVNKESSGRNRQIYDLLCRMVVYDTRGQEKRTS